MRKQFSSVMFALAAAAAVAIFALNAIPASGQAQTYRAPRAPGHPESRFQRDLAGDGHGPLRHRTARGEARDGPSPGPVWAPSGGACPVIRGGRRRSRRPRHRRGRRDPLHAGRTEEEAGEPGEVARAGSGDQVLPARRAARDLHALPVSDFPELEGHFLRLRVRGSGPERVPEGPRARSGRFLDGTVGRTLRRRDDGDRRDRAERSDLVRPGGKPPQRQAACC